MTVTGAQLQEYLAGLDYPVSREDLVRWGQENGVSTGSTRDARSTRRPAPRSRGAGHGTAGTPATTS